MASIDHSQHAAIRGSVTVVLQRVNVELQQLLVRREEVSKRIRSLYTAVNALEDFAANAAPNNASAARRAIKGKRRDSKIPFPRSIELTDDASLKLRRACRIALLETEEPLSEQEICARILRRGSFSFVNANSACPAILKELTAMSEAGEIQRLLSGSNSGSNKWLRIPPE